MPQQTVLVDPTTPANQAQVDGSLAAGGHFAERVSIRPMDFGQPFGSYGSYTFSGTTGTTAASAGAIFICAFRWSDPNRLCLVRRVRVGQGWIATTFTAGACVAEMLIARQYTVIDSTGGTLQTLTGNAQKRRATMGNTQATIYMATTGALSGGTRVTDSNSIATIVTARTATDGATMLEAARGNLWDPAEEGRYPLTLANNEGFLIRSTAPASGTYATSVDIDWDEVAAF